MVCGNLVGASVAAWASIWGAVGGTQIERVTGYGRAVIAMMFAVGNAWALLAAADVDNWVPTSRILGIVAWVVAWVAPSVAARIARRIIVRTIHAQAEAARVWSGQAGGGG